MLTDVTLHICYRLPFPESRVLRALLSKESSERLMTSIGLIALHVVHLGLDRNEDLVLSPIK